MAGTAQGQGSQTCTIGTEHTLLDIAIAGTFQLVTDHVLLADGDVLELRAYLMVLTGGTRRVTDLGRFAGPRPLDDLIARSLPYSNELTDAGALRFTMKQTLGTGRVIPWKVLKF